MGILDWLIRRGKPKLEHRDLEGREDQKKQNCPIVKAFELPISVLPETALSLPPESKTLPCGCFMEIQFAELSHLPVMLKREVSRKDDRQTDILRRELQVLSQIHHPNILLLMGIVKTDLQSAIAIFESAYYGTLYYLLHNKRTVLPLMLTQKFLNELCHVMIFLHERGWLHTSISSHTVLITVSFVLKLTGFESAQTMETQENRENRSHEHHLYQCFHWQAPEQLSQRNALGKMADVFSVGLLTWEMCTGAEPWLGYTSGELTEKYDSLTCAISPKGLFPPPFCNLVWPMQQMLQIDPLKRCPSFKEVRTHLNHLQVSSRSQKHSGTIQKAHVISQPQLQKITSTFNEQDRKQQADRDPFTGLKRVPRSWKKLERTTNYITSADTRKLRLNYRTETCRFIEEINKNNRPEVTEDQYISDKIGQNHLYHKDMESTANHFTNINISHTSARNVERKCIHNQLPQPSLVNNIKDQTSHTVPIKPASHQNQRATFRRNPLGMKETKKPDSIQFLNGQRSNLKATNDPSKIQNKCHDQFGSLEKENIKYKGVTMKKNSYDEADLECTCYLEQQQSQRTRNTNTQNYNINITCSDDGDSKTFNKVIVTRDTEFVSEENKPFMFDRVTHPSGLQCHLKEDESTSTDSGIYTTQKGDDKKISQANSTEDLYIDDEFGSEMELESHMQLMCFSESEFDDYILDNNVTGNNEKG